MVDKYTEKIIVNPGKRIVLFRDLPVNNQGFILLKLSSRVQTDILCRLHNQEIVEFLKYLGPDDATGLLQHIGSKRRKHIIDELSEEVREKVEYLLKFNPKSAARLMSTEYVEITKGTTIKQVSNIIRKHEQKTGKMPAIIVVVDGYL